MPVGRKAKASAGKSAAIGGSKASAGESDDFLRDFEMKMRQLGEVDDAVPDTKENSNSDDELRYFAGLLSRKKKTMKKKRKRPSVTDRETNEEGEFNVSTAATAMATTQGEGVTVERLLETLKSDQTVSILKAKKKLRKIADPAQQTLGLPLEPHERDKLDRAATVEYNRDRLRSWQNTIQELDKQETKVFPLHQAPTVTRLISTSRIVADFVPQTPLEKSIHSALTAAGIEMVRKDEDDEEAIIALDEEGKDILRPEAEAIRQQHKAQLRALMSYKQQKLARIKKIKSKTYRKIHRKAKTSADERRLERLEKIDPAAAALQRREKMEKQRAMERATQRHRSNRAHRFHAKATKQMAKFIPSIRDERATARSLAAALTRKFEEPMDADLQPNSEDEDDEDDEEEDENERNADPIVPNAAETARKETAKSVVEALRNEITNDPNAPANATKGLHSLPFMKRKHLRDQEELLAHVERLADDVDRVQRGEAPVNEEALDFEVNAELDVRDPDVLVRGDSDDERKESKRTQPRQQPSQQTKPSIYAKPKPGVRNSVGPSAAFASLRFMDGDDSARSSTECPQCLLPYPSGEDPTEHLVTCMATGRFTCASCNGRIPNHERKLHKKECTILNGVACTRCGVRVRPCDVSTHQCKEASQQPRSSANASTTDTAATSDKPSSLKKTKASKPKKAKKVKVVEAKEDDDEAEDSDDELIRKMEAGEDIEEDSADDEDGSDNADEDDGEERMQLVDSQEYLISRAFAGDNVDEAFMKEKEAAIAKDATPIDETLALPGWGEWGGADPKLNQNQKARFEGLKEKQRHEIELLKMKRRDANLTKVIINEDEDTVPRKYQTSHVPFAYETPEDFREAIAHPLAPELNTVTISKKQLAPKAVWKQGTPILPITPMNLPPKPAQRTERRKVPKKTLKGQANFNKSKQRGGGGGGGRR